MTALELATTLIDKLQEENRRLLDTLRKVQDKNKFYELRIDEKDRLIKVLEERIRTGTDGLLEMTNRQKGITISHLEKQIEQLLKKNENLEDKLEAIKADMCTKCETKLLLSEGRENIPSKSYKPPMKGSSLLFEKKSSQTFCPNRLRTIVEHKDKRINQLIKEVQRLKNVEAEMTQKVYRLTKLMPMSRLPPEAITDSLLKEIQELELQKQSCKINCDTFQLHSGIDKTKQDDFLASHPCTGKTYVPKSADRYKKSAASSEKISADSLPRFQQPNTSNNNGVENEVLFRKLQKLCNDVNELRRLFAFESEKLSNGINSTANEYNLFKIQLEELMNNLNDVVQNILMNDFNVQQQDVLEDMSSDDKCVISGLQGRLKESLGTIAEYEKENKILKGTVSKLTAELAQQCACSGHKKCENFRSCSGSSQNIYAKESHANCCQNLIEELQKIVKHSVSEKVQCCHANIEEEKLSSSFEQQNKILQTKLNVAEKHIKTYETAIEELQVSKRNLEAKNAKLESELSELKNKAMPEASDQQDCFLYTNMSSSDTHVNILKKHNQELKDKVKVLEEANSNLQTNAKFQAISLEAAESEKAVLKSKREASEKHICSLEKSIEVLQHKLKTVENERNKLEVDLKDLTLKKNLAETYEQNVMSLKAELIAKGQENEKLRESLHTLENKTVEMNHYRKELHKEIEKLCKTIMENENMNIEDGTLRKSIYKAAVLHSAQALLHLDDNYNLKPEDSGRNSALDEMKQQIDVYLTELARINELVTIKEQQRDELLKEYLDLPEDFASLRHSPSRHHEGHTHGEATHGNLQSSPNVSNSEATHFSIEKKSCSNIDCRVTVEKLKNVQVELAETKTVTNFLLSNCSRLEDLLSKESFERQRCEIELQLSQESVKDLNSQLSVKNDLTKLYKNLLETMRSKECSDEITHEQLKSGIKWLESENQKIFEKVTATRSELDRCKEENSKILYDLSSIKKQLKDKEYENAIINQEMKDLRSHMSICQSALLQV